MNQAHSQAVETVEFSAATLQRFARELAKYPTEQKQSAVIACLSILQEENGQVSPSRPWRITSRCPSWGCTKSSPSTTCSM